MQPHAAVGEPVSSRLSAFLLSPSPRQAGSLLSMRWVCFPGRRAHQALFHLSYLLDILCKIDSLRHCETPPTWLCPWEPVSHGDNSFLGSWCSEVLSHPPHHFLPSLFLLHQDVAAFSSAAENGDSIQSSVSFETHVIRESQRPELVAPAWGCVTSVKASM